MLPVSLYCPFLIVPSVFYVAFFAFFVFVLCVVPNVACVSVLSILDCPFSFLERLFSVSPKIKPNSKQMTYSKFIIECTILMKEEKERIV